MDRKSLIIVVSVLSLVAYALIPAKTISSFFSEINIFSSNSLSGEYVSTSKGLYTVKALKFLDDEHVLVKGTMMDATYKYDIKNDILYINSSDNTSLVFHINGDKLIGEGAFNDNVLVPGIIPQTKNALEIMSDVVTKPLPKQEDKKVKNEDIYEPATSAPIDCSAAFVADSSGY